MRFSEEATRVWLDALTFATSEGMSARSALVYANDVTIAWEADASDRLWHEWEAVESIEAAPEVKDDASPEPDEADYFKFNFSLTPDDIDRIKDYFARMVRHRPAVMCSGLMG